MTYFSVLLFFIVPPLIVLAFWVPRRVWSWLFGSGPRPVLLPYGLVLLHVVLALLYTTPWDNYLVATGVWWYDPALVTGLRLGYVPIEEYTFFILQTLLTGLWTIWLLNHLPPGRDTARPASKGMRRWSSLVLAAGGILSALPLVAGWRPGHYMALILVWAILPILVQTAFGADILLRYARPLLPAIAIPTLYLWIVDAVAINSGTWTIDPAQTIGLKLGPLPIEEMVFFLATNTILAFGITLMAAAESRRRATLWLDLVRQTRKFKPQQG